jgi:hypothetical protein
MNQAGKRIVTLKLVIFFYSAIKVNQPGAFSNNPNQLLK